MLPQQQVALYLERGERMAMSPSPMLAASDLRALANVAQGEPALEDARG
jgi:hypothetical protein